MPHIAYLIAGVIAMAASQADGPAKPDRVEYLADHLGRFAMIQQGWGELGINTCTHAPGLTPLRLRIKDTEYDRGLGHHANGFLLVELDGEYEAFEAEVGVQWQQGTTGTVVFRVLVDGEVRFDSGVMREVDEPRKVRVDLAGAQEMSLVANDGGDGITCDCANWAEARLIRAEATAAPPRLDRLDAAPFARVVTSDPDRLDGTRANRTQEYRAEDVFLEDDLLAGADGTYAVPVDAKGRACVGLVWMERRLVRELGLEIAPGQTPAPADAVRVQCWVGESAWQGGWRDLEATVEAQGQALHVSVDRERNPEVRGGVRKVRWTLPATGESLRVTRLVAITSALVDTMEVSIRLDEPRPGIRGQVEAYNGAFLEDQGSGTTLRRRWDLSRPLRLALRYTRPREMLKYDRTLLILRLPWGGFAVSADDLLAHQCVYVKDYGVFVTREPAPVTPEEYRARIAGRKTVLQQVRERPDQTFARAMERVHNPVQDNGPTMLSLACDNHKFVVERDGGIGYDHLRMTPRFGSGANEGLTRHLYGGWLPIPVTRVKEGGLGYSERTYVAPYGSGKAARPLGVAEFTVENEGDTPASGELVLDFALTGENQSTGGTAAALRVEACPAGVVVAAEERLVALVAVDEGSSLSLDVTGSAVALSGTLPAHARATCTVYLPAWEMQVRERGELDTGADLLAATERYWQGVMSEAMQVEVPEPLLNNVIRASQVHCLIAARSEAEGERIAPWIASMSYGPLESEAQAVVRGMDLMGHQDFARRGLMFFVHRYNEAGFLTTGYTLMGTGWHLWTLAGHYQLTADEEWMRSVAAEVARVCRWVTRQREKTKRFDPMGEKMPEYGLMPPGIMADWGTFGYFFFLNGQFYAGLHDAGEALAEVGEPGAQQFLDNAAEFRQEILRAYRWIQARSPVVPLRDGTWVPFYPSLVHCPGPTADFFPGEDWGRVWANNVEIGTHHLVPLGVLEPRAKQTDWIVNYMEDVPFLADGMHDYPASESEKDWFNLGGFAKLQPYYCRIAETYALRDEVKPFIRAYFNALPSLLNTENLSLWEHFRNAGAWNKTHETGWFLVQTRTMLVTERGDELWLAPFVPAYWLENGQRVSVRQAPTAFGAVSYHLVSHVAEGYIEARVDPPDREAPGTIVVRIRHPEGAKMRAVTVNGKAHDDFDSAEELVRLRPRDDRPLVVRASY